MSHKVNGGVARVVMLWTHGTRIRTVWFAQRAHSFHRASTALLGLFLFGNGLGRVRLAKAGRVRVPLKKASLISSSEAEFEGFSQSDSATVLSGSKVKAVPSPLNTNAPPSLARDEEERVKVALDARCSVGKLKPSGLIPYRNKVESAQRDRKAGRVAGVIYT